MKCMSSFYVQRDMVSQHIAQPCGRVESDRKILVKTFVCPRGTHNSRSSLTAHVAHRSKDRICLPRGTQIKRSSLSVTWHTHQKIVFVSAVVLVGALRHNADEIEEILRFISEQVLQVAHKAVDVALSRRLVNDVLIVVVAKASRQLFIVHLRLVLANPPPSSNLGEGENYLKNAIKKKRTRTILKPCLNNKDLKGLSKARWFENIFDSVCHIYDSPFLI